MSNLIAHICRCDIHQADRLQLMIKVWMAYLGLIFIGGVVLGAPLYVWFDRERLEARGMYQAENQRMQDINRQLLLIIEQRLPAIAEKAGAAAETAQEAADTAKDAGSRVKGAAKTARGAATTANAAATSARSAASTAKGAAEELSEALTPSTPKPSGEVPAWLDTP
ncbi:hypothetical protein RBI13_18660 [Alcaligenaceae bacterium A4P071]|nr:hypothetical protein [Alcaligenaceae bacterium A4P071]